MQRQNLSSRPQKSFVDPFHSSFPPLLLPSLSVLSPTRPRGILCSLLCLFLTKILCLYPQIPTSLQNSLSSPKGLGFFVTNVRKTSRLFLSSALFLPPLRQSSTELTTGVQGEQSKMETLLGKTDWCLQSSSTSPD